MAVLVNQKHRLTVQLRKYPRKPLNHRKKTRLVRLPGSLTNCTRELTSLSKRMQQIEAHLLGALEKQI